MEEPTLVFNSPKNYVFKHLQPFLELNSAIIKKKLNLYAGYWEINFF